MSRLVKNQRSQSVQFLFTLVLFLGLVLCGIFVVSFGARIYENVGQRMNENFNGTVAVSYVANKVRQGDQTSSVSVYMDRGTDILRLEQEIYGKTYQTLIYFLDGSIRELFCEKGSELALEDGIPVMESSGIQFEMTANHLLKIETQGENGDRMLLAIRSEGGWI